MLVLEFNIEGESEMLRRLEGISQGMKNWTPQFQETGDLLIKTFKQTFDTQGGIIGERWPPLSESTLKQKLRKGYSADPLIRTGTMKNSFVSSAQPLQVMVWNPLSYFKYHQSKAPRKKIPRRVMMKLDQRLKSMIPKIFQRAIENILQKRS